MLLLLRLGIFDVFMFMVIFFWKPCGFPTVVGDTFILVLRVLAVLVLAFGAVVSFTKVRF